MIYGLIPKPSAYMLRAPVTCPNTITRADYQLPKQAQLEARPELQSEFFLLIRAQGTCNPHHNPSVLTPLNFSWQDSLLEIPPLSGWGTRLWSLDMCTSYFSVELTVESLRSAVSTFQHNLLSLRLWRLISQCLLSQYGTSFKIVIFLFFSSDHLHFLVFSE